MMSLRFDDDGDEFEFIDCKWEEYVTRVNSVVCIMIPAMNCIRNVVYMYDDSTGFGWYGECTEENRVRSCRGRLIIRRSTDGGADVIDGCKRIEGRECKLTYEDFCEFNRRFVKACIRLSTPGSQLYHRSLLATLAFRQLEPSIEDAYYVNKYEEEEVTTSVVESMCLWHTLNVDGNTNLVPRYIHFEKLVDVLPVTKRKWRVSDTVDNNNDVCVVTQSSILSSKVRKSLKRITNTTVRTALRAALKSVLKGESSVCLDDTDIGDDGAKLIAQALPSSKVSDLRLKGNMISDDGVRSLAQVLPRCEVVALDLSRNNIGDGGAKALANVMSKCNLTSLTLDKNKIGSSGVATLKKVCVDRCDLSVDDRESVDFRVVDEGEQSSTPPVSIEVSKWIRHDFLLCCVLLAVYIRTAYPYVSGGDTGELVVTTCNWGVAHPPGYPLYTMLGVLFRHVLRVGPVAWRIAVGTSLLSTGAAWFVFQTASILSGGSHVAGIVAAGCYALSPLIWLYAVQGEVFGLNNLLCAMMIYLTVRYFNDEPRNPKFAYMGALVCGLAATNQHTTIFFIAPTVISVIGDMVVRREITVVRVVVLMLCVLVGLSPYLYMPYAASLKPMDSWGDQRTLEGFLHHFFRREYGTFQLAADRTSPDPGMWVRLGYYSSELLRESLYAGPVLATFGLVWSLASSKLFAASCVLFAEYALYVGVFHYLANLDPQDPLFHGVQARFWQQPNILVFIWMGVGFNLMWTIAYKYLPWLRKFRVALIIAILMCIVQGSLHFNSRDNSDNKCFRVSGESMLKSFPPKSLVMVNGDLYNNILKYPNQCEGVRRDLRIVSPQLMSWDWFVDMQAQNYDGVVFPGYKYHPRVHGAFSMKQFLDANIDRFPIILCGPWKEGDDSHVGHYESLPFGQCEFVYRAGRRPSNWVSLLRRGWKSLPLMSALGPWRKSKYTRGTWESVTYMDIWKKALHLASYIAFQSNQHMDNFELAKLACRAMEYLFKPRMLRLLERYNLISINMYRDAGIVFGQWSKHIVKSKPDVAVQYERKMMGLWDTFVRSAPPADSASIKPFVRDRINPYLGRKVQE